jgi:hypothetical protein
MPIFSRAFFSFWRGLQLVSLIPIWGMLAYFVHRYDSAQSVAPNYILVPFIVALIATGWALLTFILFGHAAFPLLVFIIDMAIVAGFIAGVVLLRWIRWWNCIDVSIPFSVSFGNHGFSTGDQWAYYGSKDCMLLKSSWGLSIAEIIMFFFTALLALMIHNDYAPRVGRGGKVYHP